MGQTMTEVQQIRLIDKRIDGIRLEMFRRTRVSIFDAGSWQLAWDRNPDLHARSEELFRQRGELQQVRDAKAEREFRAAQRRLRASYRRAA